MILGELLLYYGNIVNYSIMEMLFLETLERRVSPAQVLMIIKYDQFSYSYEFLSDERISSYT